MNPGQTRHDAADHEIAAPRQLSRSHDPDAPHERGLDLVFFAFPIIGFVILDRWLTGWLFPHASGWRWWVLAVAIPVCLVASSQSLKDTWKKLHGWPKRIAIVVTTLAVLAVLVFGFAQL